MTLLLVSIPIALVIAACAVVAFVWAARNDQYEDLDTPPIRMLMDDAPVTRADTDPHQRGVQSDDEIDAQRVGRGGGAGGD